jgi:hypothetical protein
MAYIINGARPHALTIGTTDYTSRLVNFTVSDSSAFKNGFIQTSGTLTLATKNDGTSLDDYDRNMFKRGTVVELDIDYDDGTTVRHPRGYLYILSVSYDVENEQIELEIGCELTLRRLIDNTSSLLSLAPITLDPERKTYEGISGSLATSAKYVYQDNTGTLVTKECFPDDDDFYVDTDVFESVRGVTAVSVNPLSTGPTPDKIELQVQIPSSGDNTDRQGQSDTTTTENSYFITHPGPLWKRVRPTKTYQEIKDYWKEQTPTPSSSTPSTTRCGGSNTNTPPANQGQAFGYTIVHHCDDGFDTVEEVKYIPVKSKEVQVRTYDGPAAQVSDINTKRYAYALEVNPQYYSDRLAACFNNFGSFCNPNGNCQIGGDSLILVEERREKNYYGEANEVVKTVRKTYTNTLTIAKAEDWRTGTLNGVPQNFNNDLSTSTMFLAQMQITENYQEDNAQVQKTTTYTSPASRGTGIGAGTKALDAQLSGIKTVSITKSTSTTGYSIRPDNLNSSSTITKQQSSEITLDTAGYSGPSWSDELPIRESGLVPFLITSNPTRNTAIRKYENYLKRWYQGDAMGLQITEMLRKKIGDSWYPTRSFRYYDDKNGYFAAYRMDASSWEVTPEGCYVSTDAIYMDDLTCTPVVPDNVVGDATPNMSGGTPTAPGTPNPEPVATNCKVANRNKRVNVQADFRFEVRARFGGVFPPPATRVNVDLGVYFKVYAIGIKSQPGALVTPSGDGSLPIDQGGSVIVDNSLILDGDLFS